MSDFRDRQIRAAMEALSKLWFADRIGVWEFDGDAVALACDHGLSRDDRRLAHAVWSATESRLRQAVAVEAQGAEFHPLVAVPSTMVGFVQVFRPSPRPPSNPLLEGLLDRALTYLAWAVRLVHQPLVPDVVPSAVRVRGRDPRRAELSAALSRCGWDFSELARSWGLTRQTIYNWVHADGLVAPEPYAERHRRRR